MISQDRIHMLQDAVVAGAHFLDTREPAWAPRINLKRLDMGEHDRCILGQLYGTYTHGLEVLTGTIIPFWDEVPDIAYTYGFNTPAAGYGHSQEETAFLGACWEQAIAERI